MPRSVLVTGASGFVGRHCLAPLSAKDFEIHAVASHEGAAIPIEGVHWHRADLLDPVECTTLLADVRPSHLLHLAWYAAPGSYWTSVQNVRWVQASLGLIDEFARQGGRRAVVAGTCAEYDWRYGYCSELVTPLAPATLYGVCKHSLQLMLAAMAKQMSFSVAWGRLFFLYGPHEHRMRLVPSVICSLLRHEQARCTHGSQIRDFLHVQDAADALVALLDSEVQGSVNIASGQAIALREIILTIAQLLYQHDLIRFGALPVRENEPPLLVANIDRLVNEVGWTPAYDLASGMGQTIHWWKQEIGEGVR
jgi:nucleoside-diphosphate-sugar epimerase